MSTTFLFLDQQLGNDHQVVGPARQRQPTARTACAPAPGNASCYDHGREPICDLRCQHGNAGRYGCPAVKTAEPEIWGTLGPFAVLMERL
jgi:hypothetical protein